MNIKIAMMGFLLGAFVAATAQNAIAQAQISHRGEWERTWDGKPAYTVYVTNHTSKPVSCQVSINYQYWFGGRPHSDTGGGTLSASPGGEGSRGVSTSYPFQVMNYTVQYCRFGY